MQIREVLRQGTPTFGLFLNMGSSVAAEVAAIAGFDWAIIDLEHGSGSEADLLGQLQAMDARGLPAIVRVEANDRPRFSFALDRGAGGIMVPRIANAGEATEAVAYMHYPPDGVRGVATLNRACDFGVRAQEVIPHFNASVLAVIQIESVEAVGEARKIASLDGVDVLFVGPTDLSHDMGIPGDIHNPRFRSAVAEVVDAAHASDKLSGILATDVDSVPSYLQQGIDLIAFGSDSSLMLRSMATTLSELRKLGSL